MAKHPSGVEQREFHGKFGSFGVEANSSDEAVAKLKPHVNDFDKERGYESNSKFAFRK